MKLRFAWLVLVLACSEERGRVTLPTIDECNGMVDRVLCNAGRSLTCKSGMVAAREDCASQGLLCSVGVGCSACTPGGIRCDGAKRYRCAADGSEETLVQECPPELQCSVGGCADLCAQAAADRSYLGCDYWPVFTINSKLATDFKPAIAVGNGNLVPAHVTVTRGGMPVAQLEVLPSSAQTLELTADLALKEPQGSLLLRGGAYHLVSDVPVTVHQFNPLQFELPVECSDQDSQPSDDASLHDGKCNSYTADASLLFPSTALAPDRENGADSVEFYALTRVAYLAQYEDEQTQKLVRQSLPSFVAITGVGSERAHVTVQSRARIAASPAGSADPIRELAPGDTLEVDLEPGDVLQLVTPPASCPDPTALGFCDPGPAYDLTGTHIVAKGAVQVIAGNDCSNAPFDRVACDHLEESMAPLSTWGQSALLAVPSTSAGGQYLLRVISGADGNALTFDPPLHAPATLARGETLEFGADTSVRVQGNNRILVAQYLVGANHALHGDPSLSIAVPVDQYRQSYNFISPSTYTQNLVSVIALDSDTITVDGRLVTGFVQVGSTHYRVANVTLQTAGAHEARGTLGGGFGIVLYGLGSYTSYMLPGGLDLKPIAIFF